MESDSNNIASTLISSYNNIIIALTPLIVACLAFWRKMRKQNSKLNVRVGEIKELKERIKSIETISCEKQQVLKERIKNIETISCEKQQVLKERIKTLEIMTCEKQLQSFLSMKNQLSDYICELEDGIKYSNLKIKDLNSMVWDITLINRNHKPPTKIFRFQNLNLEGEKSNELPHSKIEQKETILDEEKRLKNEISDEAKKQTSIRDELALTKSFKPYLHKFGINENQIQELIMRLKQSSQDPEIIRKKIDYLKNLLKGGDNALDDTIMLT